MDVLLRYAGRTRRKHCDWHDADIPFARDPWWTWPCYRSYRYAGSPFTHYTASGSHAAPGTDELDRADKLDRAIRDGRRRHTSLTRHRGQRRQAVPQIPPGK